MDEVTRKLELENSKLEEEIKQLKSPFWKRATNVTVFVSLISILATLYLGQKSLRSNKDDQQESQKKELEKEIKEKDEKIFALNNAQLQLDKRLLESEKSDLLRQKNMMVAIQKQDKQNYEKQIKLKQSSIDSLKFIFGTTRIILENKILTLNVQSDSLSKIINSSKESYIVLTDSIKRKEKHFAKINKEVFNLETKAALISDLTNNLKGLLLKISLSSEKNNPSLKEKLDILKKSVSLSYSELSEKGLLENVYQEFLSSTNFFIEDKNAFSKASKPKHIKSINENAERLASSILSKLN